MHTVIRTKKRRKNESEIVPTESLHKKIAHLIKNKTEYSFPKNILELPTSRIANIRFSGLCFKNRLQLIEMKHHVRRNHAFILIHQRGNHQILFTTPQSQYLIESCIIHLSNRVLIERKFSCSNIKTIIKRTICRKQYLVRHIN